MKNIIFGLFLAALSFSSCQDGGLIPPVDVGPDEQTAADATILGRWVDPNFADVIRYDFTEEARYTIYGDGSGEFPSLEEHIAENPGVGENDWWYSGDTIIVDLNFGNFSKFIPEFKCENEVVELQSFYEDGSTTSSILHREGHNVSICN